MVSPIAPPMPNFQGTQQNAGRLVETLSAVKTDTRLRAARADG
jgi:hypothetical protein